MALFSAYSQFNVDNIRGLTDPLTRIKTTTGYLLEDPTIESALLQGSFSIKGGELVGNMTALKRYTYGFGSDYYSLTGLKSSISNTYFDNGYIVDGVVVGAGSTTAEMAYWLKGADVIDGSGQADNLAGYAGNDLIHGWWGRDTVLGWSGNDTLYGDAEDDLIYGDNITNMRTSLFSGDDKLYGGFGNDTLFGCGGNDLLDAGSGTNYLDGGLGNDNYYVYNADDVVYESESSGTDTVYSTVSFAIDNRNIENLTLTGTEDTLNGFGNSAVNIITGSALNNLLDGVANSNANLGDRLIGGDGSDNYYVHSTNDVVIERLNEGLDGITVFDLINQSTGRNAYSIAKIANVENIMYYGTKQAVLTGNQLDNQIFNATDYASTMSGGLGNDVLIGGEGSDVLDGGLGNDKIYGDLGDDKIVMNTNGFDEILFFTSGAGASGDKLYFNPVKFTRLKSGVNFDEVDNGAAVDSSTVAIVFNTDNSMVYYNASGKAGGAVAIANLVGISNLSSSDIVTSLAG